jgi:hypothetical protein
VGNPWHKALLEYLGTTDLEILNQEEVTFLTENNNVTLPYSKLESEVHGLTVSPELLLSDRTHIIYNLAAEQEKMNYRNLQTNCWIFYWEELYGKPNGFLGHSGNMEDIQISVKFLW